MQDQLTLRSPRSGRDAGHLEFSMNPIEWNVNSARFVMIDEFFSDENLDVPMHRFHVAPQ